MFKRCTYSKEAENTRDPNLMMKPTTEFHCNIFYVSMCVTIMCNLFPSYLNYIPQNLECMGIGHLKSWKTQNLKCFLYK